MPTKGDSPVGGGSDHSGSLIERTARKRWPCAGDGRPTAPHHAEGCPGHIEPGEPYVECLDNAPSYQSGSRHHALCSKEFYGFLVEGDLSGASRNRRTPPRDKDGGES